MTGLLNLIYCFLMDMIASFKDLWLVGWDSILVPVDALLASVGAGGLTVPVRSRSSSEQHDIAIFRSSRRSRG